MQQDCSSLKTTFVCHKKTNASYHTEEYFWWWYHIEDRRQYYQCVFIFQPPLWWCRYFCIIMKDTNKDRAIHLWKTTNVLALNLTFRLLITRSTQRVQTSLAEADHYSHIAHCKNVEPWWWKTTPASPPPPPPATHHPSKKVLDHYLHHDLGMPPLLWCFFAHLLILEYSDHHQNLISSSLYYPGPLHKISSQSVYNFLSNVVHRQTDRQTNKQTNATKNITSFAKEVIIIVNSAIFLKIIVQKNSDIMNGKESVVQHGKLLQQKLGAA